MNGSTRGKFLEFRRRAQRRPRWSLRTTFGAALMIVVLVAIMTLVLLHRDFWIELETVTALLSVVMFMFFGHVLYRGIRFDKHERFDFSFRTVEYGDMWGGGDVLDRLPDAVSFVDLEDGCLGFIVSIIGSLIIVGLLTVLLWLGANVVINVVAVISIPLFYFFKRSLRQLVALGRTCHGRLARSCLIALRMTLLYTVWFYALIYAAHRIHFAMRGN